MAAVSKVIGFAREMIIAYVYGAGAVTDAYAVASGMVATASLLVAVYLTTTFVPTYAKVREEYGEKRALLFTNHALYLSLIINIFLLAVLQILTPFVIKLTAPGFDAEQASLAVSSARIVIFELPILAILHLLVGYMTARKSFIAPNLIGIPMSIVTIVVCLTMGTKSGVTGLSIANLAGVAAQSLIFLFWIPKEKFKLTFSLDFNMPELKNSIKLVVPALIGSAVLDINAWVDRFIASLLGEGNVSAIGFSNRLITFIQGLVIVPVAGIVFSYISEYAAARDFEKMLGIFWRTVRTILFIIFPIVIISVPSTNNIVSIVYGRGEFDSQAVLLTGSALVWYLPGLFGGVLYIFLIRFFHALQDTKTPMICGVIAVGVNAALSIWLSRFMGIAGIALGTSAGGTVSAVLLLTALRRKMGPLGFMETATDILKMALCAIPCGLAVWGVGVLLSEHGVILRFAASVCAGGTVYIVFALLLKEKVLCEVIHLVKERLSAKNVKGGMQ
jgi:putative peptidoglycan lipid II flippase